VAAEAARGDDTGQLRVAVVGAGWAGLAAAVAATEAGHAVSLFEMAPQPGGRARQVPAREDGAAPLDNGQHLLIGAYRETLRLMAQVGVDLDAVLWRTPLHLVDTQGRGLRLPPGTPLASFLRGVLAHPVWTWGERWALLRHAAAWRWRGFTCEATLTVGQLTRALPQRVRDELIDPLCVAALNTPADEASAQVFLRVLKDALLAGPGSADLLFPRQPLSALWPTPAMAWLEDHGATLRGHHRVQALRAGRQGPGTWQVDGEDFDRVILATPPQEAARLCGSIAPAWSALADALQHEPIATVYLHSPGTRLAASMLRLDSDAHQRPGQFVLDHGHWGGEPGRLALVVSGAGPWLAGGPAALTAAAVWQLEQALGPALRSPLRPLQTLVDKRATFRCTAGLRRPARHIAPGLQAAGDYVDGPYPATLEGAMQAGVAAARELGT
jgi:squalene-associated FAD-dependent desaturase